jgi:hypothetical protein
MDKIQAKDVNWFWESGLNFNDRLIKLGRARQKSQAEIRWLRESTHD